MFYRVFNSATCFPLPILKNGTFTSTGVAVLVNPATSLEVGTYIYSSSLNEVKKITEITSATQYVIESSFSSDISVAENIYISDNSIDYKEVDILNFGGVSGLLNGYEYPNNLIANMKKDTESIVFTIDGSGTKMSILGLV